MGLPRPPAALSSGPTHHSLTNAPPPPHASRSRPGLWDKGVTPWAVTCSAR